MAGHEYKAQDTRSAYCTIHDVLRLLSGQTFRPEQRGSLLSFNSVDLCRSEWPDLPLPQWINKNSTRPLGQIKSEAPSHCLSIILNLLNSFHGFWVFALLLKVIIIKNLHHNLPVCTKNLVTETAVMNWEASKWHSSWHRWHLDQMLIAQLGMMDRAIQGLSLRKHYNILAQHCHVDLLFVC